MQAYAPYTERQRQGNVKMSLRGKPCEEKLMFGRVIINKGELKVKEYDIYRSHYCGICHSLKSNGFLSSACLSYDTVFLDILLNSLYDSEYTLSDRHCICHICKKHTELSGKYTPYVSDMTLLLSYYKCLDDACDDKNPISFLYSLYLKPKFNKIAKRYPEKSKNIKVCLTELSQKEKSSSLEECANCFGKILGEVFTPNDDIWKDILYSMGFYLGKFIYIADAAEDIDDDIKKKRPNPLIGLYQSPDFKHETEIMLNMMASHCALEFEKLPVIDNAEILRNILYSGIWQSTNKDKRNKKGN